jgi:chromosomal replication initiation ATPase DnaA
MLIPIIRHGFTFWEAPHSTKPPLPDMDEPDEDRPTPRRRPRPDATPEQIARWERRRAERAALKVRRQTLLEIPIEIPSTLKVIQEAVMNSFGLKPNEFFSRSREDRNALPRIASMFLCRNLTDYPPELIGQAHGKHRATVIHSCERCEDLCETNPDYRARVDQAEAAAIRGA